MMMLWFIFLIFTSFLSCFFQMDELIDGNIFDIDDDGGWMFISVCCQHNDDSMESIVTMIFIRYTIRRVYLSLCNIAFLCFSHIFFQYYFVIILSRLCICVWCVPLAFLYQKKKKMITPLVVLDDDYDEYVYLFHSK